MVAVAVDISGNHSHEFFVKNCTHGYRARYSQSRSPVRNIRDFSSWNIDYSKSSGNHPYGVLKPEIDRRIPNVSSKAAIWLGNGLASR